MDASITRKLDGDYIQNGHVNAQFGRTSSLIPNHHFLDVRQIAIANWHCSVEDF